MIASRLTSSRTLLAAGCALIFVVALIPRLLTYNFALPYVDHPDEPASYLKAQEWQGLFDLEGYHDGYPPAFLALHLIIQRSIGANGPTGLAPTVHILRLIAAFASASVAVLLLLAAHHITRPLGKDASLAAGLVAGSLWALSPIAVEYIYATPDPYVFLFSAIALYTALCGVTARRPDVWAVISIGAGLIAVFFKYSALPVIMPGFITLIYRAVFASAPQRAAPIRALMIGIILVALSALFLLGVYGASSLNTPGTSDVARRSGFANLFNLQYFWGNLSASLQIVGVAGAIFVLLSPILLVSIHRHEKASSPSRLRDAVCQLILCYWLLITIPILVNTFNPGLFNGVRFLIPASLAGILLTGTTITALFTLIFPANQRISAAVIGLVGVLFAIPALQQTTILVAERSLPDSRVVLRTWADRNLPPGSVLVTVENHKTFNPIWGGIPYLHWFDWVERTDLTIYTPEEWQQVAGVTYIAYPAEQWAAASANLDADTVLLLGEFGGEGWRGPHTILTRIQPLQHPRELNFGDEITLKGFEFSQIAANTGGAFSLNLFWQALAQPQANYSVFLHLTPEDAAIPLVQADGAPGGSEQQTALWQTGQHFFSDTFTLTLPSDLPPGDYVVRLGLYDYLTGVRLPVTAAESTGDSAVLFSFTIGDQDVVENLRPD